MNDFRPGVGVGLAHGDDAVDRVELAPLVAGHDARRDAGRAHEDHERRREVLAEAGLGGEQELVDRVGAEQRRLERVHVPALAQERDRALQHLGIAGRCRAPLRGERARARVAAFRHAQRAAQRAIGLARPRLGRRHRAELVAQACAHRSRRNDLAVEAHARALGQARRGLEREQPVTVVRLEHDLVAVHAAPAVRRDEIGQEARPDAPGASVEVPQHRPAPVARRVWRRRALELGAKCDRIRERQARQRARAHGLREAGHAGVGVLRQAPQRALHAREEHEEHERRGRGMREQERGGAQVGARRALRRGEADQRGGEQEHRQSHGRRGRDGLGIQKVGDHQEVAEERGERGVAVGARLEQLQSGEQHEEQDPGLAPEQHAELDPHAEHRHRGDAEDQPARRQRRAVERKIHAPAIEAQREQRQPPRRALRVRRDHQHERRDQPREIAHAHLPLLRSEGVVHEYKARAWRHAARCTSPRPGAISTPRRRRP